jgi:dinuclear metal center YbgI/SA1388 family protein
MPGSAIKIAARQKISVISAHTNLDKANDGLNDYFAQMIGIKNTKPLIKSSSDPTDTINGIGRIGELESAIALKTWLPRVKDVLNLCHVRVTGNMDLQVKKIAVCTGSGGSLIDNFLKSGADVFITGDIKYHEARLVEDNSKAIIDVGHFASEHIVIDLLYNRLNRVIKNTGLNIEVKKFTKEKDPFTIV